MKNLRPILKLLIFSLFLALVGCSPLGPTTVARDRFDYTTAIADSWKRQMLLNIVKIRYGDAPIFLDVASIINQYSLETELRGTLGWSAPPYVDRQEVGENLQDHFTAPMAFRCTRNITINAMMASPLSKLSNGLQYLLFRKGLLAGNGHFGTGFLRSDPTLTAPDIRLWC